MTDNIQHSGIVASIGNGCVKVRILQSSACSSCKAAKVCNASESKEKLVDVYGDYAESGLSVGDEVMVVASRSVAAQALLLAFGLPLVLLLVALFVAMGLTGNEATGAMIGVAALVPYYLVLYLLRDKLRSKMVFNIEVNKFKLKQ